MKTIRRRLPPPPMLPLDAPPMPVRQPAPVPGPAPQPTMPKQPSRAPRPHIPNATEPVAVAPRQAKWARHEHLPPQRRHPGDHGPAPKLPPILKYPRSSSAEDLPARRGQSPGAEPGRSRVLNEPVMTPTPKASTNTDIIREVFGANYDGSAPPTRSELIKARRRKEVAR